MGFGDEDLGEKDRLPGVQGAPTGGVCHVDGFVGFTDARCLVTHRGKDLRPEDEIS